jgi:hypothetical protein
MGIALLHPSYALPFAWKIEKNIPRLAMRFRERDFLIESSKGLAKYAPKQRRA